MDKHTNTLIKNVYFRLLIMAVLSFMAMYILMYAMVDTFANVIPNLNQFYMAGLMAAPMVAIEVVLMKGMYYNKNINAAVIVVSIVALAGFLFLIRQQTAIGDKEFLKSMVPHHAGAVLMCQKANLKDAEVKQLCSDIIVGQQKEIDQMKAKLEALEK